MKLTDDIAFEQRSVQFDEPFDSLAFRNFSTLPTLRRHYDMLWSLRSRIVIQQFASVNAASVADDRRLDRALCLTQQQQQQQQQQQVVVSVTETGRETRSRSDSSGTTRFTIRDPAMPLAPL